MQQISTTTMGGEETKLQGDNLTRASIEKIVLDVHESLRKALDQLGMNSNVEKHVNELIHRANFRFSDLDSWVKLCRVHLTKCHQLKEIIE